MDAGLEGFEAVQRLAQCESVDEFEETFGFMLMDENCKVGVQICACGRMPLRSQRSACIRSLHWAPRRKRCVTDIFSELGQSRPLHHGMARTPCSQEQCGS